MALIAQCVTGRDDLESLVIANEKSTEEQEFTRLEYYFLLLLVSNNLHERNKFFLQIYLDMNYFKIIFKP